MLDNFLVQGRVGRKLKSCAYEKSKENIFLRKGGGGVKDKLHMLMLGKKFTVGAILPVTSCTTELTKPNHLNRSSALLVLTPIVII